MADDDDFREIVSNFDDGEDDLELEFHSVWEVLEHYWPRLFPGSMFVKGFLVTESIDEDGRNLKYTTSPDTAEWDAIGMMEYVKMRAQGQTVYDVMEMEEEWDNDDE